MKQVGKTESRNDKEEGKEKEKKEASTKRKTVHNVADTIPSKKRNPSNSDTEPVSVPSKTKKKCNSDAEYDFCIVNNDG